MKKIKYLLYLMICMCFCPHVAYSNSCPMRTCDSSATVILQGENCEGYNVSCWGWDAPNPLWAVQECRACKEGYMLSDTTGILSGCGETTYKTCIPDPDYCDGTCDNCVTTGWQSVAGSENHNYAKRTVATCNTLTCVCSKTVQYACQNGYYGDTVSCVLNLLDKGYQCFGCEQCPEEGLTDILSTTNFNESITDCYIEGGEDTSGTYIFTNGKCYYGIGKN